MSLLPYVFDEWAPVARPRSLWDWDKQLGFDLLPDDLTAAAGPLTMPLMSREYYRPWRHLAEAIRDLGFNIKADKEKFQVNLDVKHFSPEEISVKTADGCIIVEGKHEEKKDEHGYISRQFVRRYALPEDTDTDAVESKLSSDGVLTITARRKSPVAVKGETIVPITQTGPVRKEIKDQSEETNVNKK